MHRGLPGNFLGAMGIPQFGARGACSGKMPGGIHDFLSQFFLHLGFRWRSSAELFHQPAKLNQMGPFLIHELLQKYLAIFIRLPVCSPLIKIQRLDFD